MSGKFRGNDAFEKLHKKAESRIRNGKTDPSGKAQSELVRLNYELEIQRVELEMQNEELRRTNKALEKSRNELDDLYRSAPVAFLNISSDGLIKTANEAAYRLLPSESNLLVGSSFVRLVLPEDHANYFSYLRKLKMNAVDGPCELRLVDRQDGRTPYVQLSAAAKFDEKGRLRYWRLALVDISERRQAEETLIQQRELLKSIYDNIPVLLVLWDPKLRRFTLNRHAEEVLGWTAADANAGDFMRRVYPDRDYRNEVAAYMQSLQMGWREWVATTRNGEHVPIEWTNIRLNDNTLIGIGVDLRERKLAENALEQTLAQFEALFNQMTEGLVIFDPAGNLVDMNPAALAIHQLENIETIQRHLDTLTDTFEIFDLEERPLPTEKWPIGRVLRGETIDNYEVKVLNRHTGKYWIGSYSGIPVRDSDGKPIMSILTLRDITARKQAEAALKQSEEKFSKAFYSSPTFLFISELETGKFIEVNNAYCRLTGYTREEIVGHSSLELGILSGRQRAEIVQHIRETGKVENLETRITTKQGETKSCLFSADFLNYKGMQCLICSGMDISEHKEAEEILRQYQEKLEKDVRIRTAEIDRQYQKVKQLNIAIKKISERTIQAMESERRKLSKEIHDSIGGSLAGIKMLLENRLEISRNMPPEGITSLETIIDHLVDAIKESKRISYQLRPMALDDFGLLAALSENLKKFRQFYPNIKIDHNIQISHLSLSEELKTTLYRVIQEALTNIGKHSRADSAFVGLVETEDHILLSVEDAGVGFDVLKNLDTGQPLQGYGLLSMKERVEICRGSFQVESAPRKGTRIFASIPKKIMKS